MSEDTALSDDDLLFFNKYKIIFKIGLLGKDRSRMMFNRLGRWKLQLELDET